MIAAILNERNEVVFSAIVEQGVRSIQVAGAVTDEGQPVNSKEYRVSRSKRNLAKAQKEELLGERKHGDIVFYTE